MYQRYIKRIIDVSLASLALIILSPIMAIIVLVVKNKIGSPIFFKQVRPGLQGKPFTIYKFRSMHDVYNENNELLPDADRMTNIGSFLRDNSIDELPELLNVLRGDMSLVGPRPLLMQYLDRYTPEQARRHAVKPGITGWAQVNGRNALSWEEKFELDVWYVDNWSIWLDIKILLMTIKQVIKRQGISAPGEATMPEFYPTETRIHNHER